MSASGTDIQWFIARDGKQHGPVSDSELKKIVELGHLKPTDLVWRQGFTDWRAAASVFTTLAAAQAPVPAAPAPAPEPEPVIAPAPSPAAASPLSMAPIKGSASQSYSPYGQSPQQEPRRTTQGGPVRTGEPTLGPRTQGGPAQRTAGPLPAPGPGPVQGFGPDLGLTPGPRITTEMRKPAEVAPAPAARRRRLPLVAVGLLAMTGVGAWLMSQYKDDILNFVQDASFVDDGEPVQTANANVSAQAANAPPAAPQAVETAAVVVPSTDEVDRKLQSRTMWVAVKQGFPDWYQARVAEIARLSAERKDPAEITRYLVGELVVLRRENAKYALAASTSRHKELAEAFLSNLNQLSKESGDGCYDFISKGESSATIVARIDDPTKGAEIEKQVVAIVGAIVEGKKQPAEHAPPVKTDYDVLAGELGRLGWTQADMQLFANPKELAKAPRSRVCNMLKDWFAAHLAIQDPSTQERLLFETLKPVISG